MADGAPGRPDRASLALVAAFGLAIAAFVAAKLGGAPLVSLVAKPVPALALSAYAARQRTRYAVTVAIGLALGAAGDALLEASPRLFLAGLAAFLLGHVAYVVALWPGRGRLGVARAAPPFALGVVVLAALWPGLGPLRAPVTAYMLAICAMGACAAARVAPDRPGAWLALAGAALFLASDSALGVSRFLAPFYGQRAVVLSTYWAAQLCFALSTRSAAPPPQGVNRSE